MTVAEDVKESIEKMLETYESKEDATVVPKPETVPEVFSAGYVGTCLGPFETLPSMPGRQGGAPFGKSFERLFAFAKNCTEYAKKEELEKEKEKEKEKTKELEKVEETTKGKDRESLLNTLTQKHTTCAGKIHDALTERHEHEMEIFTLDTRIKLFKKKLFALEDEIDHLMDELEK